MTIVRALRVRAMTASKGPAARTGCGRIQSADHVLDTAARNNRNVDAQRKPDGDDEAGALARRHLKPQNPPDQKS